MNICSLLCLCTFHGKLGRVLPIKQGLHQCQYIMPYVHSNAMQCKGVFKYNLNKNLMKSAEFII